MGIAVKTGPRINTVKKIKTINAGYILKTRFHKKCVMPAELYKLCVIKSPLIKKKKIKPIRLKDVAPPDNKLNGSAADLFSRSNEWLINTNIAAKCLSNVTLFEVFETSVERPVTIKPFLFYYQ
ncbi:hypothetical protein [Agriterribacter sp.]|uniref:hypothetical protein n=1 Tax=Agriterribacter sp. TaxID=2821509 RepID=UPI002D1FA7E9|nr:hypothetical protein [Agriterribacter sp.]